MRPIATVRPNCPVWTLFCYWAIRSHDRQFEINTYLLTYLQISYQLLVIPNKNCRALEVRYTAPFTVRGPYLGPWPILRGNISPHLTPFGASIFAPTALDSTHIRSAVELLWTIETLGRSKVGFINPRMHQNSPCWAKSPKNLGRGHSPLPRSLTQWLETLTLHSPPHRRLPRLDLLCLLTGIRPRRLRRLWRRRLHSPLSHTL